MHNGQLHGQIWCIRLHNQLSNFSRHFAIKSVWWRWFVWGHEWCKGWKHYLWMIYWLASPDPQLHGWPWAEITIIGTNTLHSHLAPVTQYPGAHSICSCASKVEVSLVVIISQLWPIKLTYCISTWKNYYSVFYNLCHENNCKYFFRNI